MKKIYLFLFVLLVGVFNAQVVNFLDANFKNKILSSNASNLVAKNLSGNYFAVDANSDNQISITEAQQVSYLDVSNSSIISVYGIDTFTNLYEFRCNNNSITSLDLTNVPNIKIINCQFNNLSYTFNVVSPIKLNIADNNISTLNIYGSTSLLTDLNISNNNFTNFDINYPNLVNFSANGNPMTQLSLQNASTNFVLSPISQVEQLYLSSGTSPASLTISNFPNLKYINGGATPVNGLVIENLPSLIYASISAPIKVTVKNINPNISTSGLSFNINEFHMEDVSNTTTVAFNNVRANTYHFNNLTSVNNLEFDIDENSTGIFFDNLPALNNLKIGSYYYSTNTCIPLDFSTIPSVKNIEINEIRYNLINLTNLNQLKKLSIYAESCNPSNSIVNVNNLAQIEELIIDDSLLKTINLSSLNSLKHVKLYDNASTEITMNSLPQLLSFYLDSNGGAGGNVINNLNFNNLPSLDSIELAQPFINAIHFSNLPNLKTFKTENPTSSPSNNIALAYNFSNLPLLNTIILNHSKINQLTFNNLPSLKNLTFNESFFGTNYLFENLPALESIAIERPSISSPGSSIDMNDVSFNNLPMLKSISLRDFYYLNSINFGNTKASLQNFSLLQNVAQYGSLSSLNFTDFPSLKNIDILSEISGIQLVNLPLLQKLHLQGTKFTTLGVSNLPQLSDFKLNSNNLTSGTFTINLSNVPILKKVDVNFNNNYLKKLDLSQVPQLEELYFVTTNYSSQFATIDNVNLKNGNSNLLVMDTSFIKNVCVDDDAERVLLQSLEPLLANTIFSPYCTLNPSGFNYFVNGLSTIDFNTNGCDTSDPKFPFLKYTVNSGAVLSSTTANNTGNYSIGLPQGNHTITPTLENPTYFNISPTSVTASFPSQTSPLNQNFCLTANGTHHDLEIVIVPITAAAPGFNAKYKIIYKNKGTSVQSGNISFNYNDNLMNYSTATVAPASQTTGNLSWNFSLLQPFETREILTTFTLNTPTATPPLNGGDILNFNSLIIGATDETPSDNNFALNQTVVNSFDPNDKTCLEGSSIATTKVGDYVHYLVRFENTGTANAQNIVVKDVIDTTKFDLSSLVALNGSHSFITRITNPNTVEFIFENIQLPFANATNDGYVLFKIKTKSTLVLGDSFSNTANIYFDYNAPIVTNTYSTSVQNSLATDETEISNEFSIFPNPVSDFVSFKSPERIQKIEIFDLSGRIICANAVQNNSSDLSILSKGNYIIKAYSKQKTYIKKLIKK